VADIADGSCLGSFACAGTGREDPDGEIITPVISIGANSWYVHYCFLVLHFYILDRILTTFLLHFYPCLFPASVMVRAISLQVRVSVLGLGEYVSF